MRHPHGHDLAYDMTCDLCTLDDDGPDAIIYNPNSGTLIEHYATDDRSYVRMTDARRADRPGPFVTYRSIVASLERVAIEIARDKPAAWQTWEQHP